MAFQLLRNRIFHGFTSLGRFRRVKQKEKSVFFPSSMDENDESGVTMVEDHVGATFEPYRFQSSHQLNESRLEEATKEKWLKLPHEAEFNTQTNFKRVKHLEIIFFCPDS